MKYGRDVICDLCEGFERCDLCEGCMKCVRDVICVGLYEV